MRHPLLLALAATLACAGPSTSAPPGDTSITSPTGEIPQGPYVPGQSYFGRNSYIEYIAGDLPVIIAAPHGGTLMPASIPDRTSGTTVRDLNTDILARDIVAAFVAQTGKRPHVVITHLSRRKVDTNRDIGEGAQGNADAEKAWREFHAFIGAARSVMLKQSARGFYVDLHGHGHQAQRLELGYLLNDAQLASSDATLDAVASHEDGSSIRAISLQSPLSFSALLRGPRSLGALLEQEGFPSIPSPASPAPAAGEPYFDGGYNTDRYGCRDGGVVCAVQLEANMTGVRDSQASRTAFAAALARVLDRYLGEHAGLPLKP